MQIAELRKGDVILCCEVEQTVEHVALHPAGTVVIMKDGATVPVKHLEKNGWSIVPRRLNERVG